MSASLFTKLAEIPTIGITGTRGKSTTTHLLYEIMKAAGMDVLLGGNIKGVSTLSLLSKVTKDSMALFELDSWQCQGWGDAKMSPNIAVFTTFLDDHLNYYKTDVNAYLKDKANIFLYQTPEDTLVIGTQALSKVKENYGSKIASKVVAADSTKFPKKWVLRLPGEHNRYNAACAIEAARALGIDEEVTEEAVANFRGVPGRLELITEIDGGKVYNDTTATVPDATVAALKALNTGGKNIILIMGGADKNLNMHKLLEEIPLHTKKVILLAGTGTERVKKDLLEAPLHTSLQSAVDDAKKSAVAGDTILFSPAFASFGMFKNEYDRGDQFVKIVSNLEHA